MTSPWFRKIFGKAHLRSDTNNEIQTSDDQAIPETDSEEGQLAVDVYQDKDNVIVKSTIAGVKPEDLDISISPDTVTIQGERRQEEEIREENYLYQECYWGTFSRTISLPVEIDVERAEAGLRDGILTIVLPKASRSRTKKVKVRGEE